MDLEVIRLELALQCFVLLADESTKSGPTLSADYAQRRQHVAFEVDAKNYTVQKGKLRTKGIIIIHEHDWANSQSVYFHDLDKDVLEIVTPRIVGAKKNPYPPTGG